MLGGNVHVITRTTATFIEKHLHFELSALRSSCDNIASINNFISVPNFTTLISFKPKY